MRTVQNYDFPGNIRELENMIEHAVTLATGSRIDVKDLPTMRESKAIGDKDAKGMELPKEGIDLDRVVGDYERALLERALSQCGGSRKKTAKLLGISMRSLRYRMSKLGIESEDTNPSTVVPGRDES